MKRKIYFKWLRLTPALDHQTLTRQSRLEEALFLQDKQEDDGLLSFHTALHSTALREHCVLAKGVTTSLTPLQA